ncbi:MAG: YchJ family metal-binding protein [Alphaproteobacteria bacterium]|nr:YchJ family metal-binding protein [Alphaproteobacteria bacterium]
MCCKPLLDGMAPSTPESLVRARYSAHVLGKIEFIEKSSVGRAKAEFSRQDTERFLKDSTWNGLEIHRTESSGPEDETGVVELTFRMTHKGEDYEQRETAFFEKIKGCWFYENSTLNQKKDPIRVAQTGRNASCPCGSGKKFKKCCGS